MVAFGLSVSRPHTSSPGDLRAFAQLFTCEETLLLHDHAAGVLSSPNATPVIANEFRFCRLESAPTKDKRRETTFQRSLDRDVGQF